MNIISIDVIVVITGIVLIVVILLVSRSTVIVVIVACKFLIVKHLLPHSQLHFLNPKPETPSPSREAALVRPEL